MPRHILIKLTKTKHKERILKAAMEKQQGKPHTLYSDLSVETLQARPEFSLEGLMLKVKLQYFGHLMQRTDSFEKTLTPVFWGRP